MKLRKGKKVYLEKSSAYEMAENVQEIIDIVEAAGYEIEKGAADRLARALCQNAFSFCSPLIAPKIRIGGGFVIEA